MFIYLQGSQEIFLIERAGNVVVKEEILRSFPLKTA